MTSLIEAMTVGDLALLESLLAAGENLEDRDSDGYTALIAAAEVGDIDSARLFIERGADVNAKCNIGYTALHYAAIEGHLPIIEVLLAKGADRNAQCRTGVTPLFLAAIQGFEDVCRVLLQHGADPNIADYDGDTPLTAVTGKNGMESIAEVLRTVKADPDAVDLKRYKAADVTPLISAVASGNVQSVQLLLKNHADPNLAVHKLTPLAAAMASSNQELTRLLLEAGATFTTEAILLPDSSKNEDWDFTRVKGPFGLEDTTYRLQHEWRERGKHPKEPPNSDTVGLGKSSSSQMHFLLEWLRNNAGVAAQIVISNHIGVPRKLSDEKRAKKRTIEEISKLMVRDTTLYEDSREAMAMAEFALFRMRYRQLAELGRQMRSAPLGAPGDGVGYEDACRNELVTHGYVVQKTPPTGDQGADLLARKDEITYAIQCKNYAGSVGNSAVQEAISAKQYYGTDNAILVSDGKFTSSARELAARARVVLCKMDGIRHIDVICGTLA